MDRIFRWLKLKRRGEILVVPGYEGPDRRQSNGDGGMKFLKWLLGLAVLVGMAYQTILGVPGLEKRVNGVEADVATFKGQIPQMAENIKETRQDVREIRQYLMGRRR